MDEYFQIPVTYQGEERSFTCRLLMSGYSHKFEVEVEGQLILFEPDESQDYRALVDEAQIKYFKIDNGLLEAIARVFESIRE